MTNTPRCIRCKCRLSPTVALISDTCHRCPQFTMLKGDKPKDTVTTECPLCYQGAWKATNPVVNGFVTGCLCKPDWKLLAEAMHMLLYVDAHMASERMPLAGQIAKVIGHPWPPYPDAKDEDDESDDDEVAT